ncbi:hypothetical protein JMJ77_0003906 [Colletotrichum scovillei]|uniref:Uncharacterized protein n=1 Tax=Colletotrichum scovillei TaxID=1209932 RepID=A0A9P7QXH4_9PEZI|nr:hypothetical protein JMJ77_0003906 [Colletotrichum scovillei]KAG7049153.1 hypothetical protein JMJ78_0013136 [Colletotrichum scovillei]KAG7063895.1 hypothetical protein JMJ76_0006943 [Colletotrichum scovillei]
MTTETFGSFVHQKCVQKRGLVRHASEKVLLSSKIQHSKELGYSLNISGGLGHWEDLLLIDDKSREL